jgi:Putative Ig domain
MKAAALLATKVWSLAVLVAAIAPVAAGRQSAGAEKPLTIRTTSLPNANLRRQYRYRLEAEGGVSPLAWRVTEGSPPPGLALEENGILSGVATRAGEFHFKVTVTDSGKPAYERSRELSLRVVAPLLAEWSEYPKIQGRRVAGEIKVSNRTESAFDLTVIVLAINEIGRATAVGYQHLKLEQGASDLRIPFGETLPAGAYDLKVDVVAEVPQTGEIYRARLTTREKLQVREGP